MLVGLTLVAVAWTMREVSGGDGPAGKSGASRAVSLRLAVLEYPGKPGAVAAERFARRVDALSHGSLRIDVVSWPARLAPTTPIRRVETSAIRAVRRDDVQLGLFPSHAFEQQGVTTLRPLQAPFLITSLTHAAAVAGSLASARLRGSRADLATGLGLVPEGLYRPFGFLKPLLVPADFDGARIRADSSRTTRAVLRALGARPVDLDVQRGDTAVFSGFDNDAEIVPLSDDAFPRFAYTADDVVLFPRFAVVVASNRALRRLRGEQRRALRGAAAELTDPAGALAAERAAAKAFCAAGGTVVKAPRSALSVFRARTAPLLNSWKRDPATARLLAEIERHPARSETPLQPCAGPPAEPVFTPGFDVSNAVFHASMPPDGSYRHAFTEAALRAAGASAAEIEQNEGVTTLTFYDEPYRFAVEWQGGIRAPCRGRLDLPNRFVQLDWNPRTPCGGYVGIRWTPSGNGDLAITALDPRTEPDWLERAWRGTWRRVDCTPLCGARGKLSAGETSRLLERQLGRTFVPCHRDRSIPWDYECTLIEWNGKFIESASESFGVDVDEHGIIRTNRRSER